MSDRLFISQSVLDRWLEDGTADLAGDRLVLLASRQELELATAVLFEREVTEAGDPRALLGKVKDLGQIEALGGDYSAGTVIVGDEAYEVTDGFAAGSVEGEIERTIDSLAPPPMGQGAEAPGEAEGDVARESASDLASALGSATDGERRRDTELDLLARFFLEKR